MDNGTKLNWIYSCILYYSILIIIKLNYYFRKVLKFNSEKMKIQVGFVWKQNNFKIIFLEILEK